MCGFSYLQNILLSFEAQLKSKSSSKLQKKKRISFLTPYNVVKMRISAAKTFNALYTPSEWAVSCNAQYLPVY